MLVPSDNGLVDLLHVEVFDVVRAEVELHETSDWRGTVPLDVDHDHDVLLVGWAREEAFGG